MYIQVATTEIANPITVKAGTQITINGILYEIKADYNVYHYNDGFHTKPDEQVPAELIEIQSLNAQSRYDTTENAYKLYFDLDIEQDGLTWAGWDHDATIMFNNEERAVAGWCFADTNILYLQVNTTDDAHPLELLAGTTLIINETEYIINNDFELYYYYGAFQAGPAESMMLIEKQSNSSYNGTMYALYISVDVTAEFTWADEGKYTWDNNTQLLLNGVSTKADGWCFSNKNELYVQVSSTTVANPLTIAAGTVLYINGTYYRVQNDLSISYYKVSKTIGAEKTAEYVNEDYVLPEFSVENNLALGWEYNGGLYAFGDTVAVAAEGIEIEAVYADFRQLDGASIKIGNQLTGSGIRFTARLGETNEYITDMGILVMPADLLKNGDFVHANYTENKDYLQFAASIEDIEKENFQNEGEAYYLKGSVTKLFENNYTRTFVGRAFVKVNFVDGAKYVYVDSNANEHQRRICDVAMAALEDKDVSYTDEQKKVLFAYASEELITYAYFGPTATSDFANYKNLGMDVIWLDMIAYRYHERYQHSWTVDQEKYFYDNPALPDRDLKGAIAAAKEAGLKVIVYDVGIRSLSESKIPLIATDPANPQLLGLWLQTGDTATTEVLGVDANESYFDEANMTYTYSGCNFAGTDKAKVLKYMYQFENEAALKAYVGTLMSQYAMERNFYGVMLADEPTEDMYPQLVLMKKVIAELYPNAYAQSCQFPSYHYASYDEFKTALESYASQIEGNGDLGLDFYPFLEEELSIWDQIFGADTKTEDGVRINWLATMQYVAQTAAKYGLNFENTIQSHAMSEGYTAVSAAELALQVHMSLAFGADKLSYFTYNQHDEGGLTMTQCINSDATLAAAVTEANTYSDYLKKNMTAFEYSKSKLYGTSSNCLNTDNFTQSDLTKSIISSASNSVLVNEFYNEITGEYGYYIVNITIPDNNTSVTVSLADSATVYQNNASKTASSITLGAGEGVFVVVG